MLTKLACAKAQQTLVSLLTSSTVLFSLSPAMAGQSGAQGYFDHAPSLSASRASSYAPNNPALYEFTIMVPSNAGAALQSIKVVQDPNLDRVHFDPNRSQAFLGSTAQGQPLPLAAIGGEFPKDASEAIVTFNPPIQPGQTVTVALDATANPWYSGVYLFGVTAYPEGNQTSGLFLGYGRIQFQSR